MWSNAVMHWWADRSCLMRVLSKSLIRNALHVHVVCTICDLITAVKGWDSAVIFTRCSIQRMGYQHQCVQVDSWPTYLVNVDFRILLSVLSMWHWPAPPFVTTSQFACYCVDSLTSRQIHWYHIFEQKETVSAYQLKCPAIEYHFVCINVRILVQFFDNFCHWIFSMCGRISEYESYTYVCTVCT